VVLIFKEVIEMGNSKFDFELKDTKTPDEVVIDYANKISEETRNLVNCEVKPYDGAISSYIIKKDSFALAMDVLSTTEEKFDVQDELGEQSDLDNKFEVYLTIKGLDSYKYRIMFIRYGAISYPVKVVLNEDIAKEYSGKLQYEYIVESMEELEDMVNKIFESEFCTKLIQSLINEAMRIENKMNINS
jgi:hypothetical protein